MKTARERLVDDANLKPAARVARVKVAPSKNREIERREISRADDLILGGWALTLLNRRIADDLEREPAGIEEIERKGVGPAHPCHARNASDFRLDLVEELLERLGSGIF